MHHARVMRPNSAIVINERHGALAGSSIPIYAPMINPGRPKLHPALGFHDDGPMLGYESEVALPFSRRAYAAYNFRTFDVSGAIKIDDPALTPIYYEYAAFPPCSSMLFAMCTTHVVGRYFHPPTMQPRQRTQNHVTYMSIRVEDGIRVGDVAQCVERIGAHAGQHLGQNMPRSTIYGRIASVQSGDGVSEEGAEETTHGKEPEHSEMNKDDGEADERSEDGGESEHGIETG